MPDPNVMPPIEDRPDDTEGDDGEGHATPAELLELHEIIEYDEARRWADGDPE